CALLCHPIDPAGSTALTLLSIAKNTTIEVMKRPTLNTITNYGLLIISLFFTRCNAPAVPDWYDTNQALISEHNLTVRTLPDLPEPVVESNLEAGKVQPLSAATQLYPGVNARLFWGSGTMGG